MEADGSSSETERDSSPGATRLAIVDDHQLAREGLRDMLADAPVVEVVGEAATGREALLLCSRVRPDLVLMDVLMPEMDGLAATREIKQRYPEVSVMMVTMHGNPDYLLEALKAGAAGYVLKDAPKEQLLNSVRRVLEGESPLNQELAVELIQRLAREAGESTQSPPVQDRRVAAPVEDLTPRELEVLELLAQGKTNPAIAEDLVISRATVKVHVERIIRKLGVSDRTQAVVHAIKLGMVEPEISR